MFGFRKKQARPARAAQNWLRFATAPAVVYAIGDVHGCYEELVELESRIVDDAGGIEGDRWIVMLGDYVDRGPRSKDVIDHLLAPPPSGFRRFCLSGNHERMMLGFIQAPRLTSEWLQYGGVETLLSYGIDPAIFARLPTSRAQTVLAEAIPAFHTSFIATLPTLLVIPGLVFVHAGIHPARSLAEQEDNDLLWIREPFLSGPLEHGDVIVHGHSVAEQPELLAHRVGLDTGAFMSGRLTAGVFRPGQKPRFLQTVPAGGY